MTNAVSDLAEYAGHERVSFHYDAEARFAAIIAVHTTFEGRACGGIRYRAYDSEQAGLKDVLKLSEAMSYKSALAGLPVGGAKSVMFFDPKVNRRRVMAAMARAVDSFGGAYICAPDMGMTGDDLQMIEEETPYVVGHRVEAAPYTALGAFRALEAVSDRALGSPDLQGVRINLQGVGNVGSALAALLVEAGAELTISDIDPERTSRFQDTAPVTVLGNDEIITSPADIFVPCGPGGVLTRETIEKLQVKAVAGPANNQLADSAAGEGLMSRGITFVPDFVASAGGVIAGVNELADFDDERVRSQIDRISNTVMEILEKSARLDVQPTEAALTLAKTRIRDRSL